MIQFVEMKCPNCAGPLEKTGEKAAKCSHCGTEFLIDSGQPERVTNIYQAPPSQPRKNPLMPVVLICFFLAAFFIVTVLLQMSKDDTGNTIPVVRDKEDFLPQESEETISELFETLTEKIYGSSWEALTPEEFATLTDLHIFWENDCTVAEYAMENGELKRAELPGRLSVNYSDLRNFTGLQRLSLKHTGLMKGNLDGLERLTEVQTGNSPEELAAIISKPEQITTLGCYNLDTMTGIDAFENLEQLCVKDSDLTDIGALSALKHLRILEIESGDNIRDFGVLRALTGLERLVIESEGLKDISFLQNMTQLRELSVEDSNVLDLSPLKELAGLTSLCLEDNSEITDYSILESLTGLETLTLELSSNATMPSAENWQNLKNLSIRGADSISFLSSLPELQNLSIFGSNCSEYHVLSTLTSLESLKLSSIYGDIPDLLILNQMNSLKTLNLQSLSLYGNVEYIFGIPALEELNINDCSFGLDFAAMPENPNLKRLYMSRLEVLENIDVDYDGAMTYLDYDKVSLADNIGFLEKFPNLEELYTQSNQLTDMTFTEHLPRLKKLDITDNYVTDLRPLEHLSSLETLWCGANSISQTGSLGERVTVISDSEPEGEL